MPGTDAAFARSFKSPSPRPILNRVLPIFKASDRKLAAGMSGPGHAAPNGCPVLRTIVTNVLTEKRKKEFAALHRKRYRDRTGIFVVEGARSVDAALEAGAEVVCLVTTPEAASEVRSDRARRLGGDVETVSGRDLERISDVEHSQGVLLVTRQVSETEDALLDCLSVLVMDGIQDPGNVGTLVRTAAWFGVDAVLAGPGTSDFYNSKTVRASMGGLWDVKLASSPDLVAWLRRWKDQGGSSWAADLTGTAVDAWRPSFPSALVVGSEARGIAAGLIAAVDGRVHVPGLNSGRVTESLNASVAGGILISAWMEKPRPATE